MACRSVRAVASTGGAPLGAACRALDRAQAWRARRDQKDQEEISMPAVRVAFYARVSSDQQTEQGTIASQVAALEARILQDGLHLEPDHRFIDEGHSGATLIRPALEHL